MSAGAATEVRTAVQVGRLSALRHRPVAVGLAALGDSGGDYIAEMLTDELRVAMAQHGAHSIAELRAATVRHPAAWTFAKPAPVPLREASSRS